MTLGIVTAEARALEAVCEDLAAADEAARGVAKTALAAALADAPLLSYDPLFPIPSG
jgi:hypothetical protein